MQAASNIIHISIDGLHIGMLGAYGNTWIQTPNIDSLAAQSAVFDRYHTVQKSRMAEYLVNTTTASRKILITDDTDIYLDGNYDERHRLERVSGRATPVVTLEETLFYRALATLTDVLDNIDVDDETFYVHLYLEGFRGIWDFPLEYRIRHQDESDPAPYGGTAVPDLTYNDPDMLQSVMEAYSGGVAVLDEALGGLLEYLEDLDNTTLVFTAPRGFSLGEHAHIGADDNLYAENIHTPLIIRYPFHRNAGFRSQSLLQETDLPFLVAADVLPAVPAEVHSQLDFGEAILTPDWFYRPPELYVKPDDRWEINDVADRCPQITADFDAPRLQNL